jgi:hypothetical protein
MPAVTVKNPPKALIAMVGMVMITVLMLANAIPSEAGTGMLGAIIGYAIGNGIAAAQHNAVEPIFGEETR